MTTVTRVLLAALGLGLSSVASTAWAQTACPDLRRVDSERFAVPTRLLSASLVTVPAEGLPLPGLPNDAKKLRLSQYCRVTGYVAPQHQFEMRLPMPEQWNGKLVFAACGGFCGNILGDFCNPSLVLGYASVTSNGGHTSAPGFDGLWAANDPGAQEEFAYRGNHDVTLAAKQIAEAFYGKRAARSYMSGCSKGGQATLMAALRYPDDFDGIVTVAPVYDFTGKAVIHASWVAQANDDGKGGALVDAAALDMVHAAVLEACDATDGTRDGIVGDPLACKWKPADLACKPGQTQACLSAAQVAALTKMYAPPTDSAGRVLFPAGHALGAETQEWKIWAIGRGPNYRVAEQFMRYLAFEKTPGELHGDPLKFDFNRDPAKLARARSFYDATSVDLHAFKARGGKILMWHGWADTGIPAGSSIDYYLRAANEFGGRTALDSFFRLFLLPGVHHCQGGDGADRADMLTLLDAWVEKGVAPDTIVTTKEVKGAVTLRRPVFPYPKVARYSGTGDVNDPASWTAVEPATTAKPAGVPWYPSKRQ